jgi:hypothetical protein
MWLVIYKALLKSVNVIRFPKPANLQPKKYHNSGLENKSPIKNCQSNPIGCLNDEDVTQARPAFPESDKAFVRPRLPENLQRDTSRTNNVC